MKRYAFRAVLGLALVIGALCATGRAQDLTTQLSLFLVDLRAGILGNTQTFATLKLASGGIGTAANTTITATAAGTVSLAGTTPMIQLGGTTNAFPALKRVGANFEAKLADDSAYTGLTVSAFVTNGVGVQLQNTGGLLIGNSAVMLLTTTAPTISSGFGTSPAILSSNGTSTFRVNVGTGAVATSGVIGLPAATTGWNCQVTDMGPGAIDATRQTASTTTTVTVGASAAWAASDTLIFNCSGY